MEVQRQQCKLQRQGDGDWKRGKRTYVSLQEERAEIEKEQSKGNEGAATIKGWGEKSRILLWGVIKGLNLVATDR